MLHIPPTKVLISYSLKQKKGKSHTKSLPFGKWRFREKDQENGPKAAKDKTERARGLGRKTKGDI